MKKSIFIVAIIVSIILCYSPMLISASINPELEQKFIEMLNERFKTMPYDLREDYQTDRILESRSEISHEFMPYLSFTSTNYDTFDEFFEHSFIEENPTYYALSPINLYRFYYENGEYIALVQTGGDEYGGLYDELNAAFDNQNLPAYYLVSGIHSFILMTDGEQYLLKPFVWKTQNGLLRGSETPIITGDQWLAWEKTSVLTTDPTGTQLGGGGAGIYNSAMNYGITEGPTTYWIWFVIVAIAGVLLLFLYILDKRLLKKIKNNLK